MYQFEIAGLHEFSPVPFVLYFEYTVVDGAAGFFIDDAS